MSCNTTLAKVGEVLKGGAREKRRERWHWSSSWYHLFPRVYPLKSRTKKVHVTLLLWQCIYIIFIPSSLSIPKFNPRGNPISILPLSYLSTNVFSRCFPPCIQHTLLQRRNTKISKMLWLCIFANTLRPPKVVRLGFDKRPENQRSLLSLTHGRRPLPPSSPQPSTHRTQSSCGPAFLSFCLNSTKNGGRKKRKENEGNLTLRELDHELEKKEKRKKGAREEEGRSKRAERKKKIINYPPAVHSSAASKKKKKIYYIMNPSIFPISRSTNHPEPLIWNGILLPPRS